MSKKKFGNYGTFEAEGLDAAIKRHCKKKGITGRQFFDSVLGYSTAWWRGVRVNQYGEETELKTICQAIGYDPKKLNFEAGVVNKMAQESRDRARVNYTARQAQEPQKVAKAPEPKETYKQMELSFTDKDLGAKVRECTDDYLVETLGPERKSAPCTIWHYTRALEGAKMKKRNRKTERNRGVYDMRQSGAYYREIAEHFGISIIRVRQILEAEEAKNELQTEGETS